MSDDRWILGSAHRWDGETVRSGYATTLEEANPDDWHIVVNWRLVDGRAMPVGIEVHSSRTAHRKGSRWPDSDKPKPITREIFKHLPIGEVIEQGRAQVWAKWDAITSRNRDEPETARVRASLESAPDPSSPADWKYRLTAEVYLAVKADQERGLVGRAIAMETRDRLKRDHRIEATDGRVRKWIAEARRRRYLPPA